MKTHYQTPLFALGAFFLCANFSSQDTSITGREKPKINFYGTLTDTSGNTFEVENITISGLYKQIPLYAKPNDPKVDPTINITRIDINEISQVEIPHPNTFLTYNNRQYVEIIITSADATKTTQHYITEKTKRIICDQVNAAGTIEKDLSYQAIDKIIIKGHKTPQPTTEDNYPATQNKPIVPAKTAPVEANPKITDSAMNAPIKTVAKKTIALGA